MKSNETYDEQFGLADKTHKVTITSAMIIYLIGIWILTPQTDPIWVKQLFLSVGILILGFIDVNYILKPAAEYPDERFFMNLATAASLMFIVCVLIFLLLGLLTYFSLITSINPGVYIIIAGTALMMFSMLFYFKDKQG